jgi:hypothetical protein
LPLKDDSIADKLIAMPRINKRKPWLPLLLTPLAGASYVVGGLLELSGINGYLAKKDDRKLEDEIRDHFSFLFTEKNAHFVRNESKIKRSFDLAVVEVAAQGLLLQFVRMRGDVSMAVRSARSPENWRQVNDVLEEDEVEAGHSTAEIVVSRRSRFYTGPESASHVLKDKWDQLRRHYKARIFQSPTQK